MFVFRLIPVCPARLDEIEADENPGGCSDCANNPKGHIFGLARRGAQRRHRNGEYNKAQRHADNRGQSNHPDHAHHRAAICQPNDARHQNGKWAEKHQRSHGATAPPWSDSFEEEADHQPAQNPDDQAQQAGNEADEAIYARPGTRRNLCDTAFGRGAIERFFCGRSLPKRPLRPIRRTPSSVFIEDGIAVPATSDRTGQLRRAIGTKHFKPPRQFQFNEYLLF